MCSTTAAEYARTHRAGFLSLLRGGQDVAEASALVEAFPAMIAGIAAGAFTGGLAAVPPLLCDEPGS